MMINVWFTGGGRFGFGARKKLELLKSNVILRADHMTAWTGLHPVESV